MKGEDAKYAKIIYFLRCNELHSCEPIVTSKAVHKKHGMGIQIPSKLILSEGEQFVDKLVLCILNFILFCIFLI